MPDFRIIAIADNVAASVRSTRRSPGYGHPVHEEVATGYGPCRHCLQFFEAGRERRLHFTYDPFAGVEAFPLPGPVFIHADRCERYPEYAGFPRHLSTNPLTFSAYGRGRVLRSEYRATDCDVDSLIREFFSRDDVDYIHVRDTSAGCFDLAIERATAIATVEIEEGSC